MNNMCLCLICQEKNDNTTVNVSTLTHITLCLFPFETSRLPQEPLSLSLPFICSCCRLQFILHPSAAFLHPKTSLLEPTTSSSFPLSLSLSLSLSLYSDRS